MYTDETVNSWWCDRTKKVFRKLLLTITLVIWDVLSTLDRSVSVDFSLGHYE